jgi:hypothetical protein
MVAGRLFFDRERSVETALFRRMMNGLVKRVPDDEGDWSRGPAEGIMPVSVRTVM